MRALTFLLVFFSCSVYGQDEFQRFLGRWEGIQASDSMTVVFESDSVVTMTNRNDATVIGGRDAMRKGKRVRMIYSVDTTQKPFGLDLIIQEIETKNEQGRMKGIFEFIDIDKVKIGFGSRDNRPLVFDELAVIFTKKE